MHTNKYNKEILLSNSLQITGKYIDWTVKWRYMQQEI